MLQKIKKWQSGVKSKKIWKIVICSCLVIAILFSLLALVTRFAPSVYYTNNSNFKAAQTAIGSTNGVYSSYSCILGTYGSYTHTFSGSAGGTYVSYVVSFYNSETLRTETVHYSIGLTPESYLNGASITYTSSYDYTAGYYYTTSGLNLNEYYQYSVTGTYLELADAAVYLTDTLLDSYSSVLGFDSASLLVEFANVSKTVNSMLVFSTTMAVIFSVFTVLLVAVFLHAKKIIIDTASNTVSTVNMCCENVVSEEDTGCLEDMEQN